MAPPLLLGDDDDEEEEEEGTGPRLLQWCGGPWPPPRHGSRAPFCAARRRARGRPAVQLAQPVAQHGGRAEHYRGAVVPRPQLARLRPCE